MRTPYCINMCYAYNNKKELHNAVVILPFTFYICQVLLCLLYFNTEKGFRGCTNDVSYIYTFSSLSSIPKQICFIWHPRGVRNCSQNFLSIFTFLIILKCLILNLMESSSFHHFLLFYALMKGIV